MDNQKILFIVDQQYLITDYFHNVHVQTQAYVPLHTEIVIYIKFDNMR